MEQKEDLRKNRKMFDLKGRKSETKTVFSERNVKKKNVEFGFGNNAQRVGVILRRTSFL
jgi:hypothetical protein